MIQIITPDQKIEQAIRGINNFQNEIGEIIYEGAIKAMDLVQDRVEGQGLATNGSFLTTPSNTPIGRYGQRHGAARQKRGLSIDKVDLSFTGQMWSDWDETRNGNETGVGFKSGESRDKAQSNEELYDTKIFRPSQSEIDIAKRRMRDVIKQKIKETFV